MGDPYQPPALDKLEPVPVEAEPGVVQITASVFLRRLIPSIRDRRSESKAEDPVQSCALLSMGAINRRDRSEKTTDRRGKNFQRETQLIGQVAKSAA